MTDQWAQKQVEKFIFDFDRADKDKNGSLSYTEVVNVLKVVGFKGTDDEAKAIFSHLDKNQDDRISRNEFKACMDKLPRMSIKEYVLRKAFVQLDKDKSGYLSKTEVEDALKADSEIKISAEIISNILIYITKEDDDGKVAYDEFLRVLNFEESASVLNQIFRRLDKDGSGSLTLDEMNAAIAAEGELAKLKPRIIQLLKYHGKDLDKKINYHEFVSAWLKKKEEK
ncbi:calcium-dependent protein kinase isoform 2 [Elysia marginata]|uniref:Calcium-dependent protein kinase isoform 2 n=1 Tax=Elysia marginata TaxID=1093978 RepID=A0AAV4FCN7_9GAST|nr:calcium-dependent protein kinase isoform 2 [Elysia marginata]